MINFKSLNGKKCIHGCIGSAPRVQRLASELHSSFLQIIARSPLLSPRRLIFQSNRWLHLNELALMTKFDLGRVQKSGFSEMALVLCVLRHVAFKDCMMPLRSFIIIITPDPFVALVFTIDEKKAFSASKCARSSLYPIPSRRLIFKFKIRARGSRACARGLQGLIRPNACAMRFFNVNSEACFFPDVCATVFAAAAVA